MLSPLNVTVDARFTMIAQHDKLFTTTGHFGGRLLCRNVLSLADAIACGGLLMIPPGDNGMIFYAGEAMHGLLKLADPRVLPMREILVTTSSPAPKPVAELTHLERTYFHEYVLKPYKNSEEWRFCGVMTKLATGFGASGAIGRSLRWSTTTAGMITKTADALVTEAVPVNSSTYSGQLMAANGEDCVVGLVKLPWQKMLKKQVAEVVQNQMDSDPDFAALLSAGYADWASEADDEALFVNILISVDSTGRVNMTRNFPKDKFVTVAGDNYGITGDCSDIGAVPFNTYTKVMCGVVGAGYAVNDSATGYSILSSRDAYGSPIPVQGHAFHLPMLSTDVRFYNLNRGAASPDTAFPLCDGQTSFTGPIGSVDGVNMADWFAPCFPLLYYDAVSGLKSASYASAMTVAELISPTPTTPLRTVGSSGPTELYTTTNRPESDKVTMPVYAAERWSGDMVTKVLAALDVTYDKASARA